MKQLLKKQCGLGPFILGAIVFCLPLTGHSQKVTAVSGVSITVEDLDREVDFFTQTLDFQKVGEETIRGKQVAQLYGLSNPDAAVQVVTLQLGKEQIRLLDFEGVDSRPIAPDTRSNDLWFQHLAIVVSDMDSAYARLLRKQVVHVSTAPQTLPGYLPNAAGIKAFYFRDPEGHNLELIWFPPDKGDPQWHSETSRLFSGIDHTAIGIAGTEVSLAFYRDQLGLVRGGHSENYGTEQEHLNQVFGARLDINGLHAGAGPGVEFLRYLAPPGGRSYPADSRPSDLWHYQTEMEVDNLPALLAKMEAKGLVRVSGKITKIGKREMVLIRDPDGHAVLLHAPEKDEKG